MNWVHEFARGCALLAMALGAMAEPLSLSTRGSSTTVSIVTLWSDNGAYYLRSVPYDTHLPPNHGKTTVYAADGTERYSFDRAFLAEEGSPLFLSNDGERILAVLAHANDAVERFRAVTIYRHGALERSYTRLELTGCKTTEHCPLTYFNEAAIDREQSHWGTPAYRKVPKADLTEDERFLVEYPSFAAQNRVYLTDSKRQVHVFSLESGERTQSAPFAECYADMKAMARPVRIERDRHAATHLGMPALSDGRDALDALAQHLQMRRADKATASAGELKVHRVSLVGLLSRDGHLEVKELAPHTPRLSQAVIADFLSRNRFDARGVPAAHGVWTVRPYDLLFVDLDEQVARQEMKDEEQARQRVLQGNATLERINEVYIPKDLADGFAELDKTLSAELRELLRAPKPESDPPLLRWSLGMHLRNTWGLWANSRLAVYFRARGVHHPDDMSGVILGQYQAWLQGRTDAAAQWEQGQASNLK